MRFCRKHETKPMQKYWKNIPSQRFCRMKYLTIFLPTESLRFSKAELLHLADSLRFLKRKRGVFFTPCRIVGFYHKNRRTEKPVAWKQDELLLTGKPVAWSQNSSSTNCENSSCDQRPVTYPLLWRIRYLPFALPLCFRLSTPNRRVAP